MRDQLRRALGRHAVAFDEGRGGAGAGQHHDGLRRFLEEGLGGVAHLGRARRVGSPHHDARRRGRGELVHQLEQLPRGGHVLVEDAEPVDADGGEVTRDLGQLLAQVGMHVEQQRRRRAQLGRAVAHQREPFLLERARGHERRDVARAEVAREHHRPVLRDQGLGQRHGLLGLAQIVLAHQAQRVAIDAAGLVDRVEAQLEPDPEGPPLPRLEPRHRGHLPDHHLHRRGGQSRNRHRGGREQRTPERHRFHLSLSVSGR